MLKIPEIKKGTIIEIEWYDSSGTTRHIEDIYKELIEKIKLTTPEKKTFWERITGK